MFGAHPIQTILALNYCPRGSAFCATILVGVAAFLLSGCGTESKPKIPAYKVTGRVTFKGEPVAGAYVTFICEARNRSASGRTDTNGVYKLTTYKPNDGAVEGEHKVKIYDETAEGVGASNTVSVESEDYVPPLPDQSTDPVIVRSTLPERFGDIETSGLTAEVKRIDNNVVDFPLN